MRIKIREVTRQGLDIVEQVMPHELDLSEDFIDLESPIVVKGRLERVDNFILANLKVTYTVDTVCARCLDPIVGEMTRDYEFDFEFKDGDEFVDLGARVREEILMTYAPGTLCKEDCQGICKGCGVYLNTEECECEKRGIKKKA